MTDREVRELTKALNENTFALKQLSMVLGGQQLARESLAEQVEFERLKPVPSASASARETLRDTDQVFYDPPEEQDGGDEVKEVLV